MEYRMMEFALFRLPDGRAWLGEGPFTALATAPAAGGAFYINDFDLQDPMPWKVPARLHEITAAKLAETIHLNGAQKPQIQWAKPATEWFKMAFRRIRREVLAQQAGFLQRLDTLPQNAQREGEHQQSGKRSIQLDGLVEV